MFKRISAIIGIIILAALYITSLLAAISGNPAAGKIFILSIFCTVFIPVMIHMLLMMNNARKGRSWMDEPYSYRDKEHKNDH
ncbi:hypothetical protein SAMN05216390_101368 [Lachnospiraceae bacterium KH1T2]|nr:hypothetical protein SAMN05216390_101368 [Lachnospiraceae bacterium KH1T2]